MRSMGMTPADLLAVAKAAVREMGEDERTAQVEQREVRGMKLTTMSGLVVEVILAYQDGMRPSLGSVKASRDNKVLRVWEGENLKSVRRGFFASDSDSEAA